LRTGSWRRGGSGQAALREGRDQQVQGVSKSFGRAEVLSAVDLALAPGEFVALLGPSGCGKTTLLRTVAGLVRPDAGRLLLAGTDITERPAHRRNIGEVFQNYPLFPHLTVAENVGFGLKVPGMPAAARAGEVATALRLVRMDAFGDWSVRALSGGQQQRVALARALAIKPDLLLLDEPLAALDRKLREGVQVELRQLLRRLGITSVFVTHDQEEALVLADRIGVMQGGRLEQLSTPRALYGAPRSRFVLDFVGRSCLLAGRVEAAGGGTLRIATAHGTVRAPGQFMAGSPVEVGIRPESLQLGPAPPDANSLTLRISDRIFLGSRLLLTFATHGADRLLAEVDPALAEGCAPGASVVAWWPVAATHVFPASPP
jgi:putative spermidine/putrescine transport system ATP-binding protein